MPERTSPAYAPLRPGQIGVIAIYLVLVAEAARALALTTDRGLWPRYLGLNAAFLILYTAALWRPSVDARLRHAYFALQAAIVLVLLSVNPGLDFVTTLFVPLCYQAALVFAGRARQFWIGLLILLIGGSLMYFLGPLRGLAMGLTTMAAGVVLPAYAIANREVETASAVSEAMLEALEETHRRLEAYASQVEELAALEERNRLARELHDSVSQTMFSLLLAARAAQILLQRDPARVGPQLELLQELAHDALAQMRGLIAQMRPAHE